MTKAFYAARHALAVEPLLVLARRAPPAGLAAVDKPTGLGARWLAEAHALGINVSALLLGVLLAVMPAYGQAHLLSVLLKVTKDDLAGEGDQQGRSQTRRTCEGRGYPFLHGDALRLRAGITSASQLTSACW